MGKTHGPATLPLLCARHRPRHRRWRPRPARAAPTRGRPTPPPSRRTPPTAPGPRSSTGQGHLGELREARHPRRQGAHQPVLPRLGDRRPGVRPPRGGRRPQRPPRRGHRRDVATMKERITPLISTVPADGENTVIVAHDDPSAPPPASTRSAGRRLRRAAEGLRRRRAGRRPASRRSGSSSPADAPARGRAQTSCGPGSSAHHDEVVGRWPQASRRFSSRPATTSGTSAHSVRVSAAAERESVASFSLVACSEAPAVPGR